MADKTTEEKVMVGFVAAALHEAHHPLVSRVEMEGTEDGWTGRIILHSTAFTNADDPLCRRFIVEVHEEK